MRSALLVLLFTLNTAHAAALKTEDYPAVPDWVVRGLAAVETKSYFTPSGRLVYVDRSGDSGDSDDGRGPFQTTNAAFDMVRHPGERWANLATDFRLAEAVARRYIGFLYLEKAGKDWTTAMAWYRKGSHYRCAEAQDYARRAAAIGAQLSPLPVQEH